MLIFATELNEQDPVAVFSQFAEQPYALLLDSADRDHNASLYSYILFRPILVVESKEAEITTTESNGQMQQQKGDPFAVLQERLHAYERTQPLPGLPPFQGGAAGLLGYDLGRTIEDLPDQAKDNPAMPDVAVGIYDQVIAFDHRQKKAWLITHAEDEEEAQKKQKDVLQLLAQKKSAPQYQPSLLRWRANFDEAAYTKNIERVIEYIKAGDIFQANIAQRFDASLPDGFDPFAHYAHLRGVNPAPFAAYFNLGEIKISSASPERFLTVQGGHVETRPIKGTAPRAEDDLTDRARRDALLNSAKDRAENVMIVDLLRNDLSKVCEKESVEVSALCKLESFASVHHLVSTVTGRLREGEGAIDLLRACFPGGSITGAPKIRAMEIIEELEPTRRGPYCGSIFYVGFDGAMDSSILIRTLVYQDNSVSLQTGGGIVADSSPKAEYQETLDKAEAILRSFEGKKRRAA